MRCNLEILGYLGGFPVGGQAASSYLLTTDQGRLLIDLGSGSLLKLSAKQAIDEIDAVVLSHLHNDHVTDMLTLEHGLIVADRTGKRTMPMPVYLPSEPETERRRFPQTHFIHHLIHEGMQVDCIGGKMTFYPVRHTIPCFAVRFEYHGKIFVYSGDTQYFEGLVDIARDADVFLCEACVVAKSQHTTGKGHMSGAQAGSIAQAAQVKNLILTHLPSDGHHEAIKADAQTTFSGSVYLASEIDIWEI